MIKGITEMQLLYSKIPGFKYTIETFLSGVDAMPMVDLMMPDF